jgi:hypothetical protein
MTEGTSGTLRAEEHENRREVLGGWEAEIVSYRIGETFHCHVNNVSPGATVARAEGTTREEAVRAAVTKATERLAATRTRPGAAG